MSVELIAALNALGIGTGSKIITPTYKGARVVKTANQTIPATTNTPLTWGSASRDTNGFWSSGAPSRLTIPAGVTKVRLKGSYWTHDSSVSNFGAFFWKNGASVEGSASVQANAGNWALRSVASDVIDCVAGDYFEFVVFFTGSLIDVWPGTDTWFALEVVEGSLLNQTIGNVAAAVTPDAAPTLATFPTTRFNSAGVGAFTALSGGRGVRLASVIAAGNINSLSYAVHPYAVGAGGGFVMTGHFRRHIGTQNFAMTGMILRNNTLGKSRMCWVGSDSSQGFNFNNFSADDTWNAVSAGAGWTAMEWWQRIRCDGTTITYEMSVDGDYWTVIATESLSGLYCGTPTHVGFAANPNFAGQLAGKMLALDCLSWSYTAV